MAVVFSFLRRRHFSRKRAIRALYPKPYSSSGVSPPPDNETYQPGTEQQPGGGFGDGRWCRRVEDQESWPTQPSTPGWNKIINKRSCRSVVPEHIPRAETTDIEIPIRPKSEGTRQA